MLKSLMVVASLLSFTAVAQAQQEPASSPQSSGTIQQPSVPDPSAVDPDSPPVIRDGRDNDESTEAAEDAAERRDEQAPEHEPDQQQ
jgi:hypothetical protein